MNRVVDYFVIYPVMIDDGLKKLVYDFFFAFSRLEFALKSAGFRRRDRNNAAQPNWTAFIRKHERHYQLSNADKKLLNCPPKRQCIDTKNRLVWEDVVFESGDSNLKKVSLILRTIRNNLFHGGKYGHRSWDDPKRVTFLLQNGLETIEFLKEIDSKVKRLFNM
jgi:hypothetical protein